MIIINVLQVFFQYYGYNVSLIITKRSLDFSKRLPSRPTSSPLTLFYELMLLSSVLPFLTRDNRK